MKPQQKVKVTQQALKLLNVSNDAYRDALPRLEGIGLIKVSRAPGQRAMVEIVRGDSK
jgi:DNA-binding FadR family transcriptional regulator